LEGLWSPGPATLKAFGRKRKSRAEAAPQRGSLARRWPAAQLHRRWRPGLGLCDAFGYREYREQTTWQHACRKWREDNVRVIIAIGLLSTSACASTKSLRTFTVDQMDSRRAPASIWLDARAQGLEFAECPDAGRKYGPASRWEGQQFVLEPSSAMRAEVTVCTWDEQTGQATRDTVAVAAVPGLVGTGRVTGSGWELSFMYRAQ